MLRNCVWWELRERAPALTLVLLTAREAGHDINCFQDADSFCLLLN
jgi:hypothetical protein